MVAASYSTDYASLDAYRKHQQSEESPYMQEKELGHERPWQGWQPVAGGIGACRCACLGLVVLKHAELCRCMCWCVEMAV